MSEGAFWRNRRVLVTGGGGFLGAWISKLCVEEGAQVHVAELIRSPSDLPHAARCLVALGVDRAVDVVPLDITESAKTTTILINDGIEVIFHMAAISHINQSDRVPFDAFSLNVLGTLSVLEAARQNPRTMSVVVASSNHVYGSHQQAQRESDPMEQLDVYGASKHCQDVLTRSWHHVTGLNTVAVRNVNAYGPADPHLSHLVTGVMALALAGGGDYILRGNGRARKHYLHAEDVASAYLALAESGSTMTKGLAVNVTESGPPPSTLEVATLAAAAADEVGLGHVEVVPGTGNEQAAYHEWLDGGLMKHRTGWWPHYTLRSGLRDTAMWFKEHGTGWINAR